MEEAEQGETEVVEQEEEEEDKEGGLKVVDEKTGTV